MSPAILAALSLAVSARWSFEAAYDNVAGGDWYQGEHNETATLAWGESYVMSALAAMYRATGHPQYLDRLARHIDAVLAQRDDARGVADYRGISGACWRNLSYQDGAYCYAVHTGMIVYPMLEYVAAVQGSPFGDQPAYDGESFGDKAQAYLAAAEASAAFHDFEWDPAGFYAFPDDAGFLPYPGRDQPLNQSNALGRALILLGELTGDASYTEKATALAARMQQMIEVGSDGAYLWNYWGGGYTGNGEDISHAAINVDFAVLAARHGIVFDDADIAGFARTFVERVYVDDGTFSDFVGGGSTNDSSYRPQIGRWLALSPARASIYAAVREVYDGDHAAEGVGSGAVLLGWALLAEYEPRLCTPFFYTVDWDDLGDTRRATAYGANVLTTPPDLDGACRVRIDVDAARRTTVAQWDGDAYHRVATWRPTGGMVTRHFAYEPSWPFVYAQGGVLFEFEDSFVEGAGIVVAEPGELVAPTITSVAPTELAPGDALDYAPTASGDEPRWWSLPIAPADARVDPASGVITWTASTSGTYAFTLRVENDVGASDQVFAIAVAGAADDSTGGATAATGTDGTTSDPADHGGSGSTDDATAGSDGIGGGAGASPSGGGGCGCASGPTRAPWIVLALLWPVRRRRVASGAPVRAPARGRGC